MHSRLSWLTVSFDGIMYCIMISYSIVMLMRTALPGVEVLKTFGLKTD